MIKVNNLSVRVGDFALVGISFAVPRSAYAVMMGRTAFFEPSIRTDPESFLPPVIINLSIFHAFAGQINRALRRVVQARRYYSPRCMVLSFAAEVKQ